MTLLLQPFSDTEFILGSPEHFWNLARVLMALQHVNQQELLIVKLWSQLGGCTYIVQHKEYLGLNPGTVSIVRVSEGLGTTCSREVAVSVRTPPMTPRWTGSALLEDRREEAGRASRGIDRANTIVN